MTSTFDNRAHGFDRTNAIVGGIVFLIALIVYGMTVQRTLSFWDCGEFIACAATLGIPHPPGTPVLMLLGRILSMIPFVEDISYRINYLSVVSSAFTALFSYLVVVRVVSAFIGTGRESKPGWVPRGMGAFVAISAVLSAAKWGETEEDFKLGRMLAYIGGFAGAMFVTFSLTNWGNAVEAEAYGLALALTVAIFWLALRYHELRGTYQATRMMILAMYLALVGVGVHMTVYLVVPIAAIFFVLKKNAAPKDYAMICGFALVELLLVILLADGRGGAPVFKFATVALGIALFVVLYKRIHWGILVAIGSVSLIMISFSLYLKMATPVGIIAEIMSFMDNEAGFFDLFKALPWGILVLVGLAWIQKKYGSTVQWKTGLAIVAVGFLGFSTHYYIQIRSIHNPRIDENNPSRDYRTYVSFLDRKQYGQTSMTDRMFDRRGKLSNQLGRHANMGFWSYFEEQYSDSGWAFAPFLALGLLGMIVAIRKRMEIGIPFFTLFILGSLGLVLYMNFADGTQYMAATNEAYLEVRNRDYFFTPAFVFFGIAMGIGVSVIAHWLCVKLSKGDSSRQKAIAYATIVLVLLPGITLARNYSKCDRSDNFIPYYYSKNILDSCPPNAILFTAGDNDTFPVWCVQEAYNYRKDVRVVNLSLLNTDWYVEQMKNKYNVPISLSDEQILWNPIEVEDGRFSTRPDKPFYDKPRKRWTYMVPSAWEGRLVKVQDMMVDEIVLENKWENPICFNSLPYAESPLNLRDRAVMHGLIYMLERDPSRPEIDVEHSYDLYMNQYSFAGFENSDVYRDDNATGVFFAVGVNATRLANDLSRQGDTIRAEQLLTRLTDVYPEYWQAYLPLVDNAYRRGDSADAERIFWKLHDTLTAFHESNPENGFYTQDLGLAKYEIGRRQGNREMIDSGIAIMKEAFYKDPNSAYGFRKLFTTLINDNRFGELNDVITRFTEYKINMNDPLLQEYLARARAMSGGAAPPPGTR